MRYEKILSEELVASGSHAPYLATKLVVEKLVCKHNPEFDQDAPCDCGHPYHRHFDWGEDNEAVGCKYCGCSWHPPVEKAGLIPYVVRNGIINMMFMVSSDPAYGGPLPQISKGYVDPEDEGSKAAAIREAEEELGLIKDNMKYFWNVPEVYHGIIGENKEYTFKLYITEMVTLSHFKTPHFETKEVAWMTLEEFLKGGRPEHHALVKVAHDEIVRIVEMEAEAGQHVHR